MRCSEYTNIFRHKIYLDVTEFNIRNQNKEGKWQKKTKTHRYKIGKKIMHLAFECRKRYRRVFNYKPELTHQRQPKYLQIS